MTDVDRHAVLQTAGVGVWIWNIPHAQILWDPQMEALFGLDAGAFDGTIEAYLDALYPDDRGMVLQSVERALAERARDCRGRHRVSLPSGEVRWIGWQGHVVQDDAGVPVQLRGIALDVSSDVQAAAEIAEAMGRYLGGEGYCVVRTDLTAGSPEVVSGSIEAVTGLTLAASQDGLCWEEPLDIGHAAQVRECRVLGADGCIHWIREHATVIRPPVGEPHRLCFLTDITREKQQEQARLLHRKREALSRLAGGVAHDLNNLMTLLQVGLFELEALTSAPPEPETLTMMRQALARSRDLTRSLHTIATQRMPAAESIDLGAALLAVRPLLQATLGEAIPLSLSVPETPALCALSPADLQWALVGLATNARAAMPEGGSFSVRLSAATVRPVGLRPGDYWMMEIVDTGHGMPPETLEQAFDPYFTTKTPGTGVGLGLTHLQGLLRNIGGTVDAWSAPGVGSRFWLWCPVSASAPPVACTGGMVHGPAPARAAILLIEDEVLLREAATRILREQGYMVTAFSAAEPALALSDKQLSSFRMLFSDIQLPGINGAHAAQLLCQRHPGLRVVLTSGHVFDARAGEIAADFSFLPKPYSPTRLVSTVQRLLADATP